MTVRFCASLALCMFASANALMTVQPGVGGPGEVAINLQYGAGTTVYGTAGAYNVNIGGDPFRLLADPIGTVNGLDNIIYWPITVALGGGATFKDFGFNVECDGIWPHGCSADPNYIELIGHFSDGTSDYVRLPMVQGPNRWTAFATGKPFVALDIDTCAPYSYLSNLYLSGASNPVPEPATSTLVLMGIGLIAVAIRQRTRLRTTER